LTETKLPKISKKNSKTFKPILPKTDEEIFNEDNNEEESLL
jgi:hypothetical protein